MTVGCPIPTPVSPSAPVGGPCVVRVERRAKRLLASGSGRICVRYATGADGRILHRTAPWARAIAVAAALFSATPAVASPAPAPAADDDAPTVIERLTKAVLDWVAPAEEEEVVISTGQVQVKMGEVAPEPEPEPKPQVRMGRVAPGR